jgi:putative phosphoesterase
LSRPAAPATLARVIVGILSDTHDRVEAARAGVDLLRRHGAEYYVHCGDVGSELVLDLLAGLPSAFVFGNCDWDRRGLERYAADVNVSCLGNVGELELGGKLFNVQHGDDGLAMRKAVDSGRFDYLLCGHTHVAREQRVGRTRIINPGALHRVKQKTVAVLNTETDGLTLLAVPA